jgi:CMP/dCMP kinase
VLRDQEQRDHDDSTRAIAPLKQAADAILIDSTRIDLEHVVDRIAAVLRDRKLIP